MATIIHDAATMPHRLTPAKDRAIGELLDQLFQYAPDHAHPVWISGKPVCNAAGCAQNWPCEAARASAVRHVNQVFDDAPLSECGNLQWHEPHNHLLADNEPATCPGVER